VHAHFKKVYQTFIPNCLTQKGLITEVPTQEEQKYKEKVLQIELKRQRVRENHEITIKSNPVYVILS
jgi:precorrin-6B methylase 2